MSYQVHNFQPGDVLLASQLNDMDNQIALNESSSSLESSIANEFSSSSTYSVGDYVIYEGKLYQCTTAVTIAGSWNSTNWTQAVLGNDIAGLKSEIGNLNNLTTVDKSSLVSAINEAAQTGGSGGSPKGVTFASQMTDTDENYLYLGDEIDYEYGYIYVYLNGVWTKTTLYGKGQDGAPGANGEDGFSPVVTVEQVPSGVEISVTDKEGTTTAEVQNGTATDAQVNAWLNEHPEATTTVQDNSITPNKTTFIQEPYVYDVVKSLGTRGSITDATGAFTNNSSASTAHTDYIPVDLTKGTSVKMAVSAGNINNRWVYLYKDGTFVARTAFSTTIDRGTINLSSYVTTDAETGQKTASVNQIAFVMSNYTATAYVTNDPACTSNTLATITKTYFDFREGYKEDFYNALGLNNGGIVTKSIANGAVTGEKFEDEGIEPRKLSKGTNLIDYSQIVVGKYLGNPGINNGDGYIFWIPVIPGHSYVVNYVPRNFYFYGFWQADKTTHATGTETQNHTVSQQSNSYTITVPNISNIAYMVLSGTYASGTWKDYIMAFGILPTWKCWDADYGEPDIEYSFDWLKFSEVNLARSSIFRGKKMIVTGDSITENNGRNDNKSWAGYVREKLAITVYNDGKSGTGLVKKYTGNHSILYRVENEWATTYANIVPDIVLIMANMNDGTGANGETQTLNDLGISGWHSSGVLAVGTPNDTINTQSVYGCAKRFLEDVITKYPSAQIGWIFSTPRNETVSAWTGKENCYGHGWFEDYITAIKYQCEQYNVPVLDLYHESGFRPTNATNMNTYMDDGTTHPNTAGIKKYMVEPIVQWMIEKFGEVS